MMDSSLHQHIKNPTAPAKTSSGFMVCTGKPYLYIYLSTVRRVIKLFGFSQTVEKAKKETSQATLARVHF
jgi:hypothetical protein